MRRICKRKGHAHMCVAAASIVLGFGALILIFQKCFMSSGGGGGLADGGEHTHNTQHFGSSSARCAGATVWRVSSIKICVDSAQPDRTTRAELSQNEY